MKIKILNEFDYQTYPLDSSTIEVSEQVLEQIGITKCFDLDTMSVVDYDNSEKLKELAKQELRSKREPLLKAFDKYKTNIAYGIVSEREDEHNDIVAWYKRLLDLDENAIDNPPEKIKYYL